MTSPEPETLERALLALDMLRGRVQEPYSTAFTEAADEIRDWLNSRAAERVRSAD